MMKRFQLSAVLIPALIFIFLAAPVIAQTGNPTLDREGERFSHTIQFDVSGRITIDRELGHACTTGAVKRQTVRGFGDMVRTESVRIAPHIINVDESTDWTTAEDAIRNLAVSTTIDLCSRAMSTSNQVYDEGDYNIQENDVIHTYHPLVVDGTISADRATDQVWAFYVSANPGEEGSYHSDFIAAYGPGPYEDMYGEIDELGEVTFYDDDYRWWFDSSEDDGIDRGDYYVGNYFEIDQYAYTSGGELSRYISMSSPFSGALLKEELDVIGMAEVRESFEMDNLEGGPKAITLAWYDLF